MKGTWSVTAQTVVMNGTLVGGSLGTASITLLLMFMIIDPEHSKYKNTIRHRTWKLFHTSFAAVTLS